MTKARQISDHTKSGILYKTQDHTCGVIIYGMPYMMTFLLSRVRQFLSGYTFVDEDKLLYQSLHKTIPHIKSNMLCMSQGHTSGDTKSGVPCMTHVAWLSSSLLASPKSTTFI